MNSFKQRKEHSVWRMHDLDRSKKGSVDEPIKELIAVINAHPNYYTTSSCSGRILLLKEPENAKKKDCEWPIVTHQIAKPHEFIKALKSIESENSVIWLRMQTAILHVAAKDLEAANQLLQQFNPYGWKRSGIFSTANDIMIEINSVESMDAPIAINGATIVEEKFIENFIDIANQKLATVHEKIAQAVKRVESLHKQ